MSATVKFNKHFVTNGTVRATCWYSTDNRIDGQKCVTIYAKLYGHEMRVIFPDDWKNDSDSMTDYYETDRVTLFEGHPLYAEARARAEMRYPTTTAAAHQETGR